MNSSCLQSSEIRPPPPPRRARTVRPSREKTNSARTGPVGGEGGIVQPAEHSRLRRRNPLFFGQSSYYWAQYRQRVHRAVVFALLEVRARLSHRVRHVSDAENLAVAGG